MREATTSSIAATTADATNWHELFRCDDLKLARAVATSIAAMEFDVRVCSINPDAWQDTCENAEACGVSRCDHDIPGPHVIEVPANVRPQLAGVLSEIIDEQREFDASIELRREHHRTRLVVVLSVTTAAEVLLIWRLLEG